MADFDRAFGYLMHWEDDGLTGKITRDDGGRTRFGIAEKFHPGLTSTGFFDAMPRGEAIMVARDAYRSSEWHALSGEDINSQELANKILSLGVNLGILRVIRWAQEASDVHVDGQPGPQTLAAWNSDSAAPFHGISIDAEAHYRQRALLPQNARYLAGWLRRAQDSAEVA